MIVKPYDDDISPVKIFFPRSLSRLPCVKPTVVFNLAKNLHFKILSIYCHPFRYTFFSRRFGNWQKLFDRKPKRGNTTHVRNRFDLSQWKSKLWSNLKEISVQIHMKTYSLNSVPPQSDHWSIMYSSNHKASYLSSALVL